MPSFLAQKTTPLCAAQLRPVHRAQAAGGNRGQGSLVENHVPQASKWFSLGGRGRVGFMSALLFKHGGWRRPPLPRPPLWRWRWSFGWQGGGGPRRRNPLLRAGTSPTSPPPFLPFLPLGPRHLRPVRNSLDVWGVDVAAAVLPWSVSLIWSASSCSASGSAAAPVAAIWGCSSSVLSIFQYINGGIFLRIPNKPPDDSYLFRPQGLTPRCPNTASGIYI